MEFDKSRVYTALNADELKPGSKVVCAFSITDLKKRIDEGEQITEVHRILNEDVEQRINVYYGDAYLNYPLAYLISEPEKKKLKWTDLKLGDTVTNGTRTYIVIGIDSKGKYGSHILFGNEWITDEDLQDWEKVE